MNAVGYTFQGAIYCTNCIGKQVKPCKCAKDANGICGENCDGYGPNPVFAGEDNPDGVTSVCDACGEIVKEGEDTAPGDWEYCPQCGMHYETGQEASDCCAYDFGPDITGEDTRDAGYWDILGEGY